LLDQRSPVSFRRTAIALSTASVFSLGALCALGTGPAAASAKTITVKAVETDFHISLSVKTFKPGKYTFVDQNKGQTTHALSITGPGLKNATTKDISPGQSTKLTVTLKKGKYDIFCPVPGHKMLGMNMNVTVGSGGGSSTTATTAKSSGSGGYGY
jgi:uncharacterized cupredoxin-like copper-binding protein